MRLRSMRLNYCDVAITTTIWSKLAEEQRKILYYPFASQDTLDTAFSIPWEIKLKTRKHILRGAGRHLGIPHHSESPEAKLRHRFGPLGGNRRSDRATDRPRRQSSGHKTSFAICRAETRTRP